GGCVGQSGDAARLEGELTPGKLQFKFVDSHSFLISQWATRQQQRPLHETPRRDSTARASQASAAPRCCGGPSAAVPGRQSTSDSDRALCGTDSSATGGG